KGDLSRTDWIAEQGKILAERRALATSGQPSPRFQGEVAGSAAILSGLLLQAGPPAQALAGVNEGVRAQEQLARAEHARVEALVANQPRAAVSISGKDDMKEFRKGGRFFPKLNPLVPEAAEPRRQWAALLARRAAALAAVGRDREAVAD